LTPHHRSVRFIIQSRRLQHKEYISTAYYHYHYNNIIVIQRRLQQPTQHFRSTPA
jgi:hypothetical protein